VERWPNNKPPNNIQITLSKIFTEPLYGSVYFKFQLSTQAQVYD
jgi:hypothetical protein